MKLSEPTFIGDRRQSMICELFLQARMLGRSDKAPKFVLRDRELIFGTRILVNDLERQDTTN